MATYTFLLSGDVQIAGLNSAECRLLKRTLRRIERAIGREPWGPHIEGAIRIALEIYRHNPVRAYRAERNEG